MDRGGSEKMGVLENKPLAYWKELNPDAEITENPWGPDLKWEPWPEGTADKLRMDLEKEGYAVSPICFSPSQLTPLISIVLKVVRAGHRPAYALVYDEFYRLFRKVGMYLQHVFHSNVLIVPDEFDVHYVPATGRAAGSKPHRDNIVVADYLDAEGVPELLNVWVSLTDATLLNSCIYVLPANHDPAYRQAIAGNSVHWRLDDASIQAARAVPADAGTMLLWAPSLLHWGGRSSEKAVAPRVSVACYFQSTAAARIHPTAISMAGNLSFQSRIELINKVCNWHV